MVDMTYIGQDGNVNYDVGRELKQPPRLEHGAKYRVSEELAASLLLSENWVASKSREKEIRENTTPKIPDQDNASEFASNPDHGTHQEQTDEKQDEKGGS